MRRPVANRSRCAAAGSWPVAAAAVAAGRHRRGAAALSQRAWRRQLAEPCAKRPAPTDRERALGRRPGVHQSERRSSPGLLLRRPHRGHHARARPLQAAHRAGLWRGAALSRQAAAADGDRPGAECALSRGRQRAPHGRAGPGHRPAHRCRQRHPALGRAVRRPADRHLRGPGADRATGRRHAGVQPAADRAAAEPAQADRQSRRLRPAAAGAGAGRRVDAGRQPFGARAAGARDRSSRRPMPTPTPNWPMPLSSARRLRLVGVRRSRTSIRRSGLAQKAIELDEECVLAHSVLARAYTAQQKYDLGLAESERALQINPSDAEVPCLRVPRCCCGPAGSRNRSPRRSSPATSTPTSVPRPALNLGIAYLLKRALRRRGQAAGGGAHALSGLSAARFPAGRCLRRTGPRRRMRRKLWSRAGARIPTSISRASARASRIRR